MKDFFYNFFSSQEFPISEEKLNSLTNHFEKKTFKKGDKFIDFEDTSDKMAFIEKGLARFYLNTLEGQEFNLTFKKEGEYMMSYFTIMTNEPSPFAIEFLEDSEIYVTSFNTVDQMLSKDLYWIAIQKKLYAYNFILKAQREIDFLMNDAKTRYLKIKNERPDLVERIPQYHLALYLGINPVSLNRIIKSLD